MVDNLTQSGTGTVATDDIGGVHYQRVKAGFGADGAFSDITAGTPLPTMVPDLTASGTISVVNGNVAMVLSGSSGAAVQIAGTWTGTLQFEGTVDGSTWVPINAVAAATSGPQPTTTANGLYRLTPGGLSQVRVIATALTVGMVVVTMRASNGVGGVFANQNVPVTATGITPGSLAVTATGAAAAAVTATLPAAGAGLFHYITGLDIVLYSAAARTGSATPNVVTTTNIPGAIAFTFSTAGAIGTVENQDVILTTPLRSTATNTATTVVAPIAAGGIWRLRVTYFTAA